MKTKKKYICFLNQEEPDASQDNLDDDIEIIQRDDFDVLAVSYLFLLRSIY